MAAMERPSVSARFPDVLLGNQLGGMTDTRIGHASRGANSLCWRLD
jgi:hypothetical protein